MCGPYMHKQWGITFISCIVRFQKASFEYGIHLYNSLMRLMHIPFFSYDRAFFFLVEKIYWS